MGLSTGEILGGFAAFVPVLSTVTGVVQAFHYYKKVKDVQAQQNALKTSGKAQNVINQLRPLLNKEEGCCRKLVVTSLLQVIPLVNIVSAIFHAVYLSHLSKLRAEISANPAVAPPVNPGKPQGPKPNVSPKPSGPIEASPELLLEAIKGGRCVIKVLSRFDHHRNCLIFPSSPASRVRIRHKSAIDISEKRIAAISKKHLLNKNAMVIEKTVINKNQKEVVKIPNFIEEKKITDPAKQYTHTKSTSTTLISKAGQGILFEDIDGDYTVGFAFDHDDCEPAKFAYFKLDGHTRSQWWRQGPNGEARITSSYLENEIKPRMAEDFSDLSAMVNKEGKYAPGGGGVIPTTAAKSESQNEAYLKVSLRALRGITIKNMSAFNGKTAKMRAISQKIRLEIDSKNTDNPIRNLPIAVINRVDGPLIYKVADQKAEIEAYLQELADDPSRTMFVNDQNLENWGVTPNELSAYYKIDLSKYKR